MYLTKILSGTVFSAIIVDSTRRGKRFVMMFAVVSAAKGHVIRFPDSIAKTIPIWISVLNKVCFPERECVFYTNPLAVSPSEASQIEQRIDGFVEQFLVGCHRSIAVSGSPV